jgi:hypothetical protein
MAGPVDHQQQLTIISTRLVPSPTENSINGGADWQTPATIVSGDYFEDTGGG